MKVSVEYTCQFCQKQVSRTVEMSEEQLQGCREKAEEIKQAVIAEDKSSIDKIPHFYDFSFDKCPVCGKRNNLCGEPLWQTLLTCCLGFSGFGSMLVTMISLFSKHFRLASKAALVLAAIFFVAFVIEKIGKKRRKKLSERIQAGEIQEKNIPVFIHYID